tara:strand:+ start:4575 stop:4796 length:222 start_codon:yes stop_codon:yes gene_type:complete
MEGWKRLEFDLAVLGEIHDQIKESSTDSKKTDGAAMEARNRQRKGRIRDGDTISGEDMFAILKERGITKDKGE